MEPTALSDVRRLPDYRERRTHIFPSDGSLTWFVRQHKARLVEAGALVMLAGQWHAHESKFDAAVLAIGQDAAGRAKAAA